MKSAALIILTYNNTEFLRPVLSSAFAQTHKDLEIIIADDGSTKDTKDLIDEMSSESPFKIKHVRHEDQGYRIARARNNAASVATADVLIFVDGDMLLHPNFAADHICMSEPFQFLQGSRVLLSSKLTKQITASKTLKLPKAWSRGITCNRISAIRSSFLSKFHKSKQDYMNGTRGCNISVPRDLFLKINGFDNRFEGWGREDSEFAARLLNASAARKKLKNLGVAFHMYHP